MDGHEKDAVCSPLNLYLVEDPTPGWGEYEAAVVAASSPAEAALVHPSGMHEWTGRRWAASCDGVLYAWPEPVKVNVALIGAAAPGTKPGVVLSSYLAG